VVSRVGLRSGSQQPWNPPSGPPPRGGGTGKWIFGGIALLTVIAVTVVVTVLLVRKDSGNSSTPTTSSAPLSDIASANDKGPATIITEDPTCASTKPILDTLAGQQQNGWDKRDPSIAASAWTPAVRAQYDAVGQAMRGAADQIMALAKVTPHRVTRELYEQYIAYSTAYATAFLHTPRPTTIRSCRRDNSEHHRRHCSAISFGSAPARGPLMQPPTTPLESHRWGT